ncbi:MAG TPA: flagellar basal body P-ring formation chaperone FlgA [Candidatus Lustribacter sp.]|jgi:flagella basal body P-ring formation protein FlgA|nr:flagellar basal body P-ring formation chaperone FlgA [Candidatus Lustribacter sp.]
MQLRRFAAVMLAPFVVFTTTAAALATTTVALAPVVTQNVTSAQISAVTDKVVAGLITDPDRSIVPAFKLPPQPVPLGRVELTALTPLVYPTYVSVPVQITVDGRVARTITSGYRVEQFMHTAVAARDLAAGTLLTPDDLTTARVLSSGRPAVDIVSLVGRKVLLAAHAGSQIFVEQTAVNMLVKAGSGAILTVRDGPVSLTADVIARTGGGLGESVIVYNASTNKVLSGTVTGPNEVELVLPGGEDPQ